MSDLRTKLQAKWDERNRYANFGDAITRIRVRGVRCHRNTLIEFESPITAFTGLNGTGKSTLLQMAGVAYKNTILPQYRVSDFMILSALDPAPFEESAAIAFRFAPQDGKLRALTISRNDTSRRWQGYNRRRPRAVFMAGVGVYLPKIEKKDFVVRNANKIKVASTADVSEVIKDWTCKVLGHSYDAVKSNTVTHSTSSKEIRSVSRMGTLYSESHMGFGEARIPFLIGEIERLPNKSLVLLEEPETSLHQRAQNVLGKYLIDVSYRKGHQILLTTHSQYLLSALPASSRVFLHHEPDGVAALRGIAASQANSILTDGYEKSLVVLVEDEFAKSVLSELIRRIDPLFLSSIAIDVGGCADDLAKVAKALRKAPVRVVVVRDGDKGADPANFIFKLPGRLPPEKEVLNAPCVRSLIKDRYSVDVKDVLAAESGADHHEWFALVARKASLQESSLVAECSREYVTKSVARSDVNLLVEQLKDAAQK